jgi:amino acid adenylation domain-containing protein/non-ribosomal peptide synthase protein (TIGR01720 family)
VTEALEAQARRTPLQQAIVCGDRFLNYLQLNQQANQLAHYLKQQGLGRGDIVALCLPLEIEVVVGVLAVLKIGAAYLPLDPNYPAARIEFIVTDARVSLVLSHSSLQARLPEAAMPICWLDLEASAISAQPTDDLPLEADPGALVYVIYTSGSTGQPKGAAVFHRSFANLLQWYCRTLNVTEADRVLLVSALGFDLTQKNLFAPLLVGGSLHLPTSDSYDPETINATIAAQAITWINCTLSTFYPLVESREPTDSSQLASLRWVVLGGEPINMMRLRPWLNSPQCRVRILNSYGPTECTDVCVAWALNGSSGDNSVPLGRPIYNTVNLAEVGERLVGVWEYSSDLFEAGTIERMAAHFRVLLERIVAVPERPLHELSLLSEGEAQQLAVWNRTATGYTRQATMAGLFAEQAAASPQAVALVGEAGELSYGELEERANRLAHYLQERYEVGVGQVVGLYPERSPELIIGMLAILKAGAAYLPLECDYPEARLSFMLEDAEVGVVLTDSILQSRLPQQAGQLICLDQAGAQIDSCSALAPVSAATAESLAYVMYTSGSTGQPKGVCVPLRAIIRLVRDTNYIRLGAGDCIAQAANPAFDAATFEIWGALLNGAAVYLLNRQEVLDPERLAGHLRLRHFNVLFLTTALFNRLVQQDASLFGGLDYLLFGGEAVDPRWVRAVLANGRPRYLLHVYGPTESTTFATWHEVAEVAAGVATVPIGQPLANTQVYVLDERQQESGLGLAGELYIGGDGLAQGYLKQPELTAERFVEVTGLGRLYRTGDRCRWRQDGRLEFLGRLNEQVKLRGFRIEPGEIETLLRCEPGVQEAVVAVQGEGEHRQLVGYLLATAGTKPELETLRQSLRRKLPDYMVPSHLVLVKELPLTTNGKIDRSRLSPPPEQDTMRSFEGPGTELERKLATIWSSVLGIDGVGRHDNFFELGGDSILSIQIVAQAREEGLQFNVSDLFAYQTLADLAPHIRQAMASIPDIAEKGRLIPLTPIQKWVFSQDLEEPWHFNQAVLLRLNGALNIDVLQEALKAILNQHAALRLRYRPTATGWLQTYTDDEGALPLHVEDLNNLPVADQPVALREPSTAWQRSLNLGDGPLSRAVLFKLTGSERLFWCIHHLVVDGVSWRILLGDLQLAVESIMNGIKGQLPLASAPFSAWADYLEAYAQSPQLSEDATYWETLPEPPLLPLDFPNGEPTLDSTAHVRVCLDKDETRVLLEDSHRVYNLRINDVLLTALAQALARWTGRRDCIVDLEGHGRIERAGAPNLLRTVGWFTTIYPVRLVLPETDDPSACLKAIKEQLRAVPSEGIGYGVLRYHKASARSQRFGAPIAFNYLGQFDHILRYGLFDFAEEDSGESYCRRGRRPRLIDVDAVVRNGELEVNWGYSTNQYRSATIRRLADAFDAALRKLLTHCYAASTAGYTPSDFPLAALTQGQLDALAALHGRNIAAIFLLSPLQQGMLFHSVYEESGGAYFEQLHCLIDGPLDTPRLCDACVALLQRHAVLRTAFQADVHPPVQIVYREVELPWQEVDWRHLDQLTQQQSLDRLLADERRLGFDVSKPPLLRCWVARIGEQSYRFVWCFHHLLLDGWSLPILFRELFSFLTMQSSDLPLRKPYQNYIEWLHQQDRDAAAAYWRGYLAGFNAPTTLPAARQAAGMTSEKLYDEAVFTLDESASQHIEQFASAQHLTVNTLLQSAWALLLHRYSGDTDVLFGVTVSGRDIDLPGIDGMLGLFINTVPLRRQIDDSPVQSWLQDAQMQHQRNMRYAYIPLHQIHQDSEVPKGTPLFSTLMVFENYPVETGLSLSELGGLRLADIHMVDHTTYPLTVVASAGKTLRFRIGYDCQRYDRKGIERLFGHFRNVLVGLATSDPGCRLQDLPLIDPVEQQQLLDWSRARRTTEVSRTLMELFEEQVAQNPNRIAAVCGRELLTYGELSIRAKCLARRLRRHGAQPDRLVGLYASQSLDLLVGVIAILEAGAAYLPLDPNLPTARLGFMLQDADVAAILTQRSLAYQLSDVPVPQLYFNDVDAADTDTSDDSPFVTPRPEHLAYVIYTSGSSGQPKRVMITHANVTRLFAATQPEYRFSAEDVWTLFHSPAFDFSVREIWGTLLFGGRIVVVPYQVSRDPVAFYELLEAEGVTVLNQTPSAFRQLIPIAMRKRKRLGMPLVIFGGEALDLSTLEPWFTLYGDQVPQLVNMYGVTETTVHVTQCVLHSADTGSTSSLIGRPLADLDVYLLDAQRRLVPAGVSGEIYVGGAGLARGYLNRPSLTEEHFVEATIFGRRQRLYRSGDLARWRADGTLEYLSRIDHQVKLRGFRIELGEIEATLSQHRQIQEAVAVVVTHGTAPNSTSQLI